MWKGIIEDGEEKLIYLDSDPVDDDLEVDENKWYGEWSLLPDLVLEEIFSYLDIKARYYASLVCCNWFKIFYQSRVWHHMTVDDRTLTRRKFNYYMGYQYVLDHLRMQSFMIKVGSFITNLTILPMTNLFNLYEFMNIFFFYQQKAGQNCSRIKSFKFSFNCNLDEHGDKEIFGTGGQLLESMKRLLDSFSNLKYLELNDLLLRPVEAQYLLDSVCYECCASLKVLRLANITEVPYELLHVGTFINLRELTISPQNLGNDVIQLIGWTKLKHLFIYQNDYTQHYNYIHPKSWKMCRQHNPIIKVHLWTEKIKAETNNHEQDDPTNRDYFPLDAPVSSIVYDSAFHSVSIAVSTYAIDYYSHDLTVYGHLKIPVYEDELIFSKRCDTILVNMSYNCPNLKTLLIRDKVSAMTILLIAHAAKNLKSLYVRKKSITFETDWPHNNEWSTEFYNWLCKSSISQKSVEEEVSKILGHHWIALSDEEYKEIKHKNICY